MNDRKSQPITLSAAKSAVYFGGILVAIVLSCAAIITKQALSDQKMDTYIATSADRLERLEESDREQDRLIIKHEEVINSAKARGILSRLPNSQTSSSPIALAPTPAAESARFEQQRLIINNNIQPSQTTSEPKQEQQPTPVPTPSPKFCLIGICL
jgi:hypothetical protein